MVQIVAGSSDGRSSASALNSQIAAPTPALEEMTFAIRQTFVPAPGSTAEAPLTHLKLSAELLGADQVKAKDVEDVNQVLQQLEDIFAQNAENVKAYAEARHAGTAYNRPRFRRHSITALRT